VGSTSSRARKLQPSSANLPRGCLRQYVASAVLPADGASVSQRTKGVRYLLVVQPQLRGVVGGGCGCEWSVKEREGKAGWAKVLSSQRALASLCPCVLGDGDGSGRSVRDCNDFAGSVAWKAVERVVNREGG
jgi:hypothetical protein